MFDTEDLPTAEWPEGCGSMFMHPFDPAAEARYEADAAANDLYVSSGAYAEDMRAEYEAGQADQAAYYASVRGMDARHEADLRAQAVPLECECGASFTTATAQAVGDEDGEDVAVCPACGEVLCVWDNSEAEARADASSY